MIIQDTSSHPALPTSRDISAATIKMPVPIIEPRAFEDLLLVVRAGVTPVARVKEASADLHVEPNVLLNGAYSSLPRWLRRLLGQ